ncbi:hypothetical protein HGH92_29685 [Chitinophaga varians]|uniref:Uncharacterized protein n=1 Tax=Chitinophaga varians TaxID=2202339 RepID=A0A847RZF1_9BACT|nr:hypothetical protein [Chitinophaga varians]NLR68513.1 hypothetical protein [Chitinophaga varians]
MDVKAVVALYKAHAEEDGLPARQSGRLPMLVIADMPYYIETRFSVLRPVDPYNLSEIRMSECSRSTYDNESQLFFYDKKSGEGKDDLTGCIAENMLLVKIPESRFLDPYMYSMLTNLPVSRFLENGRMLMYRVAETVPVTQRMIDRVIKKIGPSGESYENLFKAAKREAAALNKNIQSALNPKLKKRQIGLK